MALTEEQKMEVLKLRDAGIGYLVIANRIGVGRDKVRDYCRTKAARESADRIGVSISTSERNALVTKAKLYTCKHCQCSFYKRDSDISSATYCSSECQKEHRNKKRRETREKKESICRACGKTFVRTGNQTYCSKECRYEVRECESCGERFKVRRDSMAKTCSKKCGYSLQKLTHEQYYAKFSDIHRGNIVPTTMYTGSEYNMTVWCIGCQKPTTRKAGQFLDINRVRGCGHCNRTLSEGEDRIERWLNDNNISHIKQYTIDTLVDKAPLRFDFAITNEQQEVVKLLEYDGRQHYEPVDNFGGVEEYNRQVRSDEMKNDYAKESGIELIRISYKQKKDLASILARII